SRITFGLFPQVFDPCAVQMLDRDQFDRCGSLPARGTPSPSLVLIDLRDKPANRIEFNRRPLFPEHHVIDRIPPRLLEHPNARRVWRWGEDGAYGISVVGRRIYPTLGDLFAIEGQSWDERRDVVFNPQRGMGHDASVIENVANPQIAAPRPRLFSVAACRFA